MLNLGIIISASSEITDSMADEVKNSLQYEHTGFHADIEHMSGLFNRNSISTIVLWNVQKNNLGNEILKAYREYVKTENGLPEIITYIYITCHGSVSSLSIAMSDENTNRTTSVEFTELKKMFDQIPGKKILMVDACHSGACIDGSHKKDEIKKMLEDMNRSMIRSFTRKRGTGRLRHGEFIDPDYHVIAASHTNELSFFNSDGSAFTKLWCKGAGLDWKTGATIAREADREKKGYVTFGDLCRYTEERTTEIEENQQLVTYVQDDTCWPENSLFPVFRDLPIRGDRFYYSVIIGVADEKNAGTDADIEINLQGDEGETGYFLLDRPDVDDFEQGTENWFLIETAKEIGELKSFSIRSDGKKKSPDCVICGVGIGDGNRADNEAIYSHSGKWLFSSHKLSYQFFVCSYEKDGHKYDITVKTGDKDNAGTDADIEVQLFGTGGKSIYFLLDSDADDFERGSSRTYQVVVDKDLQRLDFITVRSDDTGPDAEFYLESVTVRDCERGNVYTAQQCGKWFSRTGGLIHSFRME